MVSFTPLNMQKVAYLSDFLLFCTLFELDCIIFQMVENVPFLDLIYMCNSIKTGRFPMRLQKMFSKMFSRKWFLSVVTYPEEQIASLRICMMLHSLITVFHKSFMMSSLKTVNAISYNGLPEML